MSTVDERVRDLGRRWAEAECAGDHVALDRMTTDDFTLVGPQGFTLKKRRWLDRYRTGIVVTKALDWDEIEVRDYGAVAVTIGVHHQYAESWGNLSAGRFRATHIVVRNGDGCLLAGMHLSPVTTSPGALER